MTPLPELYAFVDAQLAQVIAREGGVTCGKGCFHCCREPAYTTVQAIRHMLDGLSPDAIAALKVRAQTWLDKFLAAGFLDVHRPDAHAYRAQTIWCPFLEGGVCTAYERRPIECRWWMTKGPRAACEDDTLRRKQTYADVPGLIDLAMRRELMGLADGESWEYDHIGILLARELLGFDGKSATNTKITRKGDELEIRTYDQSTEAPAAAIELQ